MRIKPTFVKALEKYKLEIRFNDGTTGILDLSHKAGKGVFKNWDVEDNFFKVFISKESGSITWQNDVDIDTINAYCAIKNISVEDFVESVKLQHASN